MSQTDDEGPRLTYHDQPSGLDFEWDGASPNITVSNGETIPVAARIGVNNASIERWMAWFRLVCMNYVRIKVGT